MAGLEKEPTAVATKPKSTRKKPTKKTATASVDERSGTRTTTTRKKTASRKVTAAKATRTSSGATKASRKTTSADLRQRMIAEAAYYLAERRGFMGGDPKQDWLDAEANIDATLIDSKARKD